MVPPIGLVAITIPRLLPAYTMNAHSEGTYGGRNVPADPLPVADAPYGAPVWLNDLRRAPPVWDAAAAGRRRPVFRIVVVVLAGLEGSGGR